MSEQQSYEPSDRAKKQSLISHKEFNDRYKFSFITNTHKDMGSQGSSILPKLDQNFIFQVF